MKAMVRSPDGDADFFNIFSGILQRDTFASFMIIICIYYVLQMYLIKKMTSHEKRQGAGNIPQKLTGADYADNLTFLANTPTQAES